MQTLPPVSVLCVDGRTSSNFGENIWYARHMAAAAGLSLATIAVYEPDRAQVNSLRASYARFNTQHILQYDRVLAPKH
jgi:hypothetical protein